MNRSLISERHEVENADDALEYPVQAGWSDGLPVVPPTEERVEAFLDVLGLEPGHVVAEIPERHRSISVEKIAINAVMAGCRPEYFPVVVAAIDALGDPRFRFNHLASLGSPWPLIIVNGPVINRIGLNSGTYLFGPGHQANMTIARAVSLTLRNCVGAKVEDAQRGQWGNGLRAVGCIAENESVGWLPLHVQRGFAADDSTVTVVSSYPGSPSQIRVAHQHNPERMLRTVAHAVTNIGGAEWVRGTYVLLVSPHMVDTFVRENWTKEDVRRYMVDNTKSSLAELKYRGVWGKWWSDLPDSELEIHPGDDTKMYYLLKSNGADDAKYLFKSGAMDDHEADYLVVCAGGDAGSRMQVTIPYQAASNPITRRIPVATAY
jgi:hypothetical protein